MNIGEKAFVFALGALLVVGVAALATSAAGAPDEEVSADELTSTDVEIVETDGENGTYEAGGATFEVNMSGNPNESEATDSSGETGERIDRYDGVADYYHVPVDAVEDDTYDHDFDPSEESRDDFAGATGYVVEADKVDTDDPRVVAHVAENDPEIDAIAHADDVETRQLDIDDKDCRENDEGTEVCRLSLNETDASE